jgi:hypothetical protein
LGGNSVVASLEMFDILALDGDACGPAAVDAQDQPRWACLYIGTRSMFSVLAKTGAPR